jgi:hypothetical protein
MTENGLVLVEKHEYEYCGPIALCDRSAVQAQKGLRDTDAANAAKAGGHADTEHGELAPFYSQELNAEHLFTPGQTGELLTSTMAPLGSELGNVEHQAELEGARTRNASGFTKTLQQAARDRMKAAAGASEGVAAQDILGAKQLNQEGAAGMSNLFNTDSRNQLQSLGLEEGAIQGQVDAGKSGWLQNLNQTLQTIGSLGGAGKFKMPGGGSNPTTGGA